MRTRAAQRNPPIKEMLPFGRKLLAHRILEECTALERTGLRGIGRNRPYQKLKECVQHLEKGGLPKDREEVVDRAVKAFDRLLQKIRAVPEASEMAPFCFAVASHGLGESDTEILARAGAEVRLAVMIGEDLLPDIQVGTESETRVLDGHLVYNVGYPSVFTVFNVIEVVSALRYLQRPDIEDLWYTALDVPEFQRVYETMMQTGTAALQQALANEPIPWIFFARPAAVQVASALSIQDTEFVDRYVQQVARLIPKLTFEGIEYIGEIGRKTIDGFGMLPPGIRQAYRILALLNHLERSMEGSVGRSMALYFDDNPRHVRAIKRSSRLQQRFFRTYFPEIELPENAFSA